MFSWGDPTLENGKKSLRFWTILHTLKKVWKKLPITPLEWPVGGRKSSSPKNHVPWDDIRRTRFKIYSHFNTFSKSRTCVKLWGWARARYLQLSLYYPKEHYFFVLRIGQLLNIYHTQHLYRNRQGREYSISHYHLTHTILQYLALLAWFEKKCIIVCKIQELGMATQHGVVVSVYLFNP